MYRFQETIILISIGTTQGHTTNQHKVFLPHILTSICWVFVVVVVASGGNGCGCDSGSGSGGSGGM